MPYIIIVFKIVRYCLWRNSCCHFSASLANHWSHARSYDPLRVIDFIQSFGQNCLWRKKLQ
jgi:hypothetical protein